MLEFATTTPSTSTISEYRYREDPFLVGFMDDATLVAPMDQAMVGAETITVEGAKLGFAPAVGPTKNKLWAPSSSTRSSLDATYTTEGNLTIHTLREEGTDMLGAPIGTDEYVGGYMKEVATDWKRRLEEV